MDDLTQNDPNGAFLPGALILEGFVLEAYVDPTDYLSQGH